MIRLNLKKSSNIASAMYNQQKKLLMVVFHSGGEYAYFGVEAHTIESWLLADSVGSFFHYSIKKGGYEYEKVEELEVI